MIVPEPTIVPSQTANKDFWYNDQIERLFKAIAYLQLTARDGAIQNADKAGNLNAVWVVFTSNAVANTEDAIAHTLGRTPVGMIPSLPGQGGVLYMSTQPTSATLFLKSTTPSTIWKVLVF